MMNHTMDQSANSSQHAIRRFIKDSKTVFCSPNPFTRPLVDQLENISTIDFASLSNNRVELNNFFSILWNLMSSNSAFLHSGTLVLINALKDAYCKHALIHTFRFIPVLTEFLLNTKLSSEDRVKMLNLIEDLTVGLKINWLEPYVLKLMQNLYAWIMNQKDDETELRKASLSVLVNLCDGNPFVVNLSMEYMDMKKLINRLIESDADKNESVEVCRLLLIFKNLNDLPSMTDVHRFLEVSLQAFSYSVRNIQKRSLRHVDLLINEMCSNSMTKSHVLTFEYFETHLEEVIKHVPMLFAISNDDCKRCLQTVFNIFTALISLELYSMRNIHKKIIIELCVKANMFPDLVGRSYHLLANIVSQYEEDGMVSDEVASAISLGLQGLLDPIKLDVKIAGIEWLRFICALNDCHAMRDSILHNVNVEKFEDIVKQIVHIGKNGNFNELEPVVMACHICMPLMKRCVKWDACLHHILSESTVQKILSGSLNNVPHNLRRRYVEVVRSSDFPSNRINEVFFHKDEIIEHNISNDSFTQIDKINIPNVFHISNTITNTQKAKVDNIVMKIEEALQNNKIESESTLDLIELYRYKISNMEHNLNITEESLKTASQTANRLNHSVALMHETNKRQEEILINTQFDNEKLKENVARLAEQMGDAEKTIRKFQVKLTGEKFDREQQAANIHKEYSEKIMILEKKIIDSGEELEKICGELKRKNDEKINLEEKLLSETKKSNELGCVLTKFEKKVRQNDEKLKEANQRETNLKSELMQLKETNKTLEKTLLEREQRLTQLTSQVEEMQRVQEMIASLMHKGSANMSN